MEKTKMTVDKNGRMSTGTLKEEPIKSLLRTQENSDGQGINFFKCGTSC